MRDKAMSVPNYGLSVFPAHQSLLAASAIDVEVARARGYVSVDRRVRLTRLGFTKEPIPVVPAQHYTCGGILIDLNGRTDLPGLYAAGECTESGLHGANRLASNSLLECFVFGEAAAADILARWDQFDAPPAVRGWDESRVTDSDEEVVIKQNWTEIRRSAGRCGAPRVPAAWWCARSRHSST